MKPSSSRSFGLFAVLVTLVAVFGVEPSGDCGEYLLMARAFASHATPAIQVDDAAWVSEHEPRLRGVLAPLFTSIPNDEPVVLGSIFRAPSGSYYSFHFWFYSLLCAPFLWLTAAVGAYPVVACGLVNAAAVIAAGAYLQRTLAGAWVANVAPFAFLLAGTTYYLGWTGPETLTAASVLVSAVAALRGDAGLAILCAGVAATQNPSAGALIPFATAAWVLLRVRPAFFFASGSVASPLDRRTVSLAVTGVLLAAAPYFFFLAAFGKPSLIGEHATSRELIGWDRAWSLLFDLNQGMLIGVPGVLLGVLAALGVAATPSRSRAAVVAWAGATLAVMGIMIVPALSSQNWNSGAVVFMRYAYWLAMPLLALLVLLLGRLEPRPAWGLAAAIGGVQLTLLAVNGVWGERAGYTEHGWAAKLVLRRWPGRYNPVPEIFHERSVGKEAPPVPGLVVEWPRKGRPKKLLAFTGGPVRSKRLCRGRFVLSRNEVPVAGGARYLNPPFRCSKKEAAP